MTSSMESTNYLSQGTKQLMKCQKLANHLSKRTEAATRLSRRYEQLLRSEKYCDCQFNVVNTKIKCHKLILSASSPVFEAMFYGPMRDAREEIDIDDISPEIFQLLIAYIYAGCLDFEQLSLEETIELYYSAEKYLLNELVEDCLMAVTHKLRFDNILPALELSVCMNLTGLLDICMSFFTRCCLGDAQYMCYMKANNQHHISKECIKAIIAANKNCHNCQLLWFVLEWCQQECHELGLEKSDYAMIIDDLALEKTDYAKELNDGGCSSLLMEQTNSAQFQTIERTYYKACRPFIIDYDIHIWKFSIKCEHFISLYGLILQSRLMPTNLKFTATMSSFANAQNSFDEYNENFVIEIRANNYEENNQNVAVDPPLVWRYVVSKQLTKYNCDLNIRWNSGVVLSPDIEYVVTLSWSSDACGAEYPCSLMSSIVEGIKFRDYNNNFGSSIVKGLSYIHLV